MKTALLSFTLVAGLVTNAQYYYKDVIGTKESAELIKTYEKAGISAASVNSYDADDTRNEDFYVMQTFSKPHARLRTVTRNGSDNESVLITLVDEDGRVSKTIDSSLNLTSITEYGYNADGQLAFIKSVSSDTSKRLNENEMHQWYWDGSRVARMLRIINNIDTTLVEFKLDGEKVVEEWSTRRGIRSEPVYYYYNAQNHLTDIVRYNKKAGRLLPEYMFEYSTDGKLIQRITVPANSSSYLIWRYQYNAEGLKTKEAIYDRNKTLTGKIEYIYTRS